MYYLYALLVLLFVLSEKQLFYSEIKFVLDLGFEGGAVITMLKKELR